MVFFVVDRQEVDEAVSPAEIIRANKQPSVVHNEKLNQKCKNAKGGEKNKKETLEYAANARENMLRMVSTSQLMAILVEVDSIWDFRVSNTKVKIIGHLYLKLTLSMFQLQKGL